MHIKLSHLSHQFQPDHRVLSDLNLEDNFSSLALIGPSGSGKSTLLRILGGLIIPSAGEIAFNNQQLNFSAPSLAAWHKKIGFVFQHNGLFPHLTGLENIILPLIHVFKIKKEDAVIAANRFVDRFKLSENINKYPYELSGGQCQRIAIARAVLISPELLLLDEPTSALDPEFTAEVLDMLHELLSEGLNMILVTHEMGFAQRACEKIMFLNQGKINEYGNSKILFTNPKTPELKAFLEKVLEWN